MCSFGTYITQIALLRSVQKFVRMFFISICLTLRSVLLGNYKKDRQDLLHKSKTIKLKECKNILYCKYYVRNDSISYQP